MAYFQYYIGLHLYRPTAISDYTTYSGADLTNQQTYNSGISLPVNIMNGDLINQNFFYLASSAIDNTYRINILESKAQVADSNTPGYVVFNGRQESEGNLYGGDVFTMLGTTNITFPYTLDNSNTEGLRLAVGNGLLYLPNGNIDTTNSKFRSFTFGEASVGSPWASPPDPLMAYLKSKIAGNNKGNPTYIVNYIKGTFDTTSQTWGSGTWWNSTFGSLTSVPRSFYVGINDNPQNTYIKVTLSSNLLTASAMVSAIQNAINNATSSLGALTSVAVSLSSNMVLVQPWYDRTTGGIFQITLMVDPNDIGGASNNLLTWTGLLGSNTYVEAYDYSSVINFYYSLVSSWTVSGSTTAGLTFTINNIPYTVGGTGTITALQLAAQIGAITQTGYFISNSTTTITLIPNYNYVTPTISPPTGITFTPTGTSYYRIGIAGQGSYSKFAFIDGTLAISNGFLANYNMNTVTQNFYHTRGPLSSYQKLLNYGGDFRCRDGYFRNLNVTGVLNYSSATWTGTSNFQYIVASNNITSSGTLTGSALAISGLSTLNGNVNIQVGFPGLTMNIGNDSTNILNINSTVTFVNNVSVQKVLSVGSISLDGVNNALSVGTLTMTTGNVTNLNVANLNFTGNFGISSAVTTQVSGKFDSGTTAPAHTVRLNYDGYFYSTRFVMSDATTASGTALVVDGSGNILKTSSDLRLKKNIKDLNYGINTVMKLHPVSFNWKSTASKDKKRNIGFIAQEVMKVIPEAVQGTETDTTYLGMNADYIVPALTKAIQQQQIQLNSLSESINKLKSKIKHQ
jgi:hypothetical protein